MARGPRRGCAGHVGHTWLGGARDGVLAFGRAGAGAARPTALKRAENREKGEMRDRGER
jgi:hypothetical protein